MKLVKLLAADSILKNNPDKEFDELRFAVDDGTNILIIINKGEITALPHIQVPAATSNACSLPFA